jgi:hypothetical protein
MADMRADPVILGNVADLLHSASTGLEDGASAAPQVPDAGDCTGPVAALLAHLAASAGLVVDGTSAAAAATADSSKVYTQTDQDAADGMPRLEGD